MKKIILASKSPRRSFLLKEAGLEFEVRTREVDESYPPEMPVEEVAEFLAKKKADGVSDFIENEEIIITSDTIVILNNVIYGKPKDDADAVRMLREISGTMHRVITGVCIRSKEKEVAFSDIADVYISDMTDAEIRYYIDKCQPFDKAGSYGIQEWLGYVKVARIDGSYATVMGLPVHRVYETLQNW
mgnify:CR=1 FL=1